MDSGAWWATIHVVTKGQTRLRDYLSIYVSVFYPIDVSTTSHVPPSHPPPRLAQSCETQRNVS